MLFSKLNSDKRSTKYQLLFSTDLTIKSLINQQKKCVFYLSLFALSSFKIKKENDN